MVDATKFQTMERFLGINNVEDKTRLVPTVANHEYVYPLQQASNVEIDNSYAIRSRSGFDNVLSGTDIHSLWSDGDTCLYVDELTLTKLYPDYTTLALRSGLTHAARMSYAPNNDRVYYSNGHEIGYVKANASSLIVDPAIEFKIPLPSGQLIEYYRGSLYVAKENVLYISDPLCDYFDIRTGYKQFTSNITLLRAVDDGIYIGDTRIWWLKGDGIDAFERVEAYAHPAIMYTDTKVNGQHVGDGVRGNVAIWTCNNGICVGGNDGNVANVTEARYLFAESSKGAGFIKEKDGLRQYINSLY